MIDTNNDVRHDKGWKTNESFNNIIVIIVMIIVSTDREALFGLTV